jgi:hypothetical protein
MTFPVLRCEEWQCRYVFPNGKCCRHPIGHGDNHFPVEAQFSIGSGLTYLECPCCGDNGAASDGEGCFWDGQLLICGCPGWVSVDEDGEAWINSGDAPCVKCEARDNAQVSNRTQKD